ncbi:hypothetical protein CBM2586_A11449 [Cupriavidus phytorum]|uniref:Uncharacterized protein n=1 Tax=Cupriavidus taiwanensis TaxID=164546 RepID=A0A375BE33_9BURK|nr:hypothetical protein CBM2586_A11449 [Cupriavidus taiwanensis]
MHRCDEILFRGLARPAHQDHRRRSHGAVSLRRAGLAGGIGHTARGCRAAARGRLHHVVPHRLPPWPGPVRRLRRCLRRCREPGRAVVRARRARTDHHQQGRGRGPARAAAPDDALPVPDPRARQGAAGGVVRGDLAAGHRPDPDRGVQGAAVACRLPHLALPGHRGRDERGFGAGHHRAGYRHDHRGVGPPRVAVPGHGRAARRQVRTDRQELERHPCQHGWCRAIHFAPRRGHAEGAWLDRVWPVDGAERGVHRIRLAGGQDQYGAIAGIRMKRRGNFSFEFHARLVALKIRL